MTVMANTLYCDIVTPEKGIFSGEVGFIALQTQDGEIGVLPRHLPMIASLGLGEVRLKDENDQEIATYAIAGGYAGIEAHHVTILADHARHVSEIDMAIINERIQEISQELKNPDISDDRRAFLQEEFDWVNVQARVHR